ncbi:hypothetical protein L3Y34_013204 [Caenorhabditis briggsae]|uniref:Uncharacterized protein n=1 Tax=Caenorhabditis briggsae TaxID=6238 RepID=A0AAE8ZUC3_CAEBR|nr:hypothetical protein L3Y34_013204 [Caenorhabditis briggsae]
MFWMAKKGKTPQTDALSQIKQNASALRTEEACDLLDKLIDQMHYDHMYAMTPDRTENIILMTSRVGRSITIYFWLSSVSSTE